MAVARAVSIDVSDIVLRRPDGTAAGLGGGPRIVVLMRHRH